MIAKISTENKDVIRLINIENLEVSKNKKEIHIYYEFNKKEIFKNSILITKYSSLSEEEILEHLSYGTEDKVIINKNSLNNNFLQKIKEILDDKNKSYNII